MRFICCSYRPYPPTKAHPEKRALNASSPGWVFVLSSACVPGTLGVCKLVNPLRRLGLTRGFAENSPQIIEDSCTF